ncbi:MAG: sulfotransferase [Spirochaetia bacterium]|nr:sulfotransferase [Spirochaetia bacterium]
MKSIFIVGYWNSGTTLLVDLLRKHPEVKLKRARYKPNLEERDIVKILKKLDSNFIELGDYSEVIENGFKNYNEPIFAGEKKEKFNKEFLKKFKVKENKYLLLKNPWLFFMPNFIKNQFSDFEMKKIIILRHGHSQVVSKDYWLRNTDKPELKLFARAKFWVRAMEYFFENWHNKPDTLVLRYESVCENPHKLVRQICDFINIKFEPIEKKVPDKLENKLGKWNQLPDDLKKEIDIIIKPIQEKLDSAYPI